MYTFGLNQNRLDAMLNQKLSDKWAYTPTAAATFRLVGRVGVSTAGHRSAHSAWPDDTSDEAAGVVRQLIESMTTMLWDGSDAQAKAAASPEILLVFAADAENPRRRTRG